MTSVCLYFQIHQPFRIRRYSVFDQDPFYFDNVANRAICEKVAEKCYRPATRKLLDLIRRNEGRFKVAFAITGTALEQFSLWTPDVIELFQEMAATGSVELLGETSHHSLSFLFSRAEFEAQVAEHEAILQSVFDAEPTVFRNTELMYNNDVAAHLGAAGRYRAVLCEGVDRLLEYRSPNYVYAPPDASRVSPGASAGASAGGEGPSATDPAPLRLLLKNYSLSDDIAFRFSDRNWSEWPLTAERFAHWVDEINGDGYLCNLFMDYETLGEHQWADTGIFEFLDKLPASVFDVNPGQNDFVTPSEAVARYAPIGEYSVPETISWADTERDLSAWLGNSMQDNAAAELYRLEEPVKARHAAGDEHILEDWRKLTTSDHLYYMCTKYWADGDVHKYFSPYDSPYDAYINFVNVLDNVRSRAEARTQV